MITCGGRTQLSVTIVDAGGTPQPSPLSERSTQQLLETPLDSENQAVNATSLLIESPPKWGDAARYATREHRKIAGRATFQGQVTTF
ncbi:hypothetical protein FQR65_LT02378 [Abscondita terminalis]|nr:hypothetical protein FQR65_LT02378 [Abscondita terminalis]